MFLHTTPGHWRRTQLLRVVAGALVAACVFGCAKPNAEPDASLIDRDTAATHTGGGAASPGTDPAPATGGGSAGGASGGDGTLTLPVGGHEELAGLGVTLGFARVTSDSRCPTDVTCVWAGRAVARTWLVRDQRDTAFVDVTIEAGATETAVVDTLGVRITPLGLDPYPAEPRPIPEVQYRLRLRVARSDS